MNTSFWLTGSCCLFVAVVVVIFNNDISAYFSVLVLKIPLTLHLPQGILSLSCHTLYSPLRQILVNREGIDLKAVVKGKRQSI